MEIIKLATTDSTNTWAAAHDKEVKTPALVWSVSQTSGKGQKGNSWESEPGRNITASLIFRPEEFPAFRQFHISETVALAVTDFLDEYGIGAKIKWPNDIYVGDKKICGILVEHVVLGKNIARTIAGMGINMNQTDFTSDAPNPVSLKMLTGETYDIETGVEKLAKILEHRLTRLKTPEELHSDFLLKLWRNDGQNYRFRDKLKNEEIIANIKDVGKDGVLTLMTIEGDKRQYAFKEVEFIL